MYKRRIRGWSQHIDFMALDNLCLFISLLAGFLIVQKEEKRSEKAILYFFGGALAIGIAAYNNTMKEKLPMPRHIIAVSPGEVPWNDAERAVMQANNPKDMMVDYAFMEKVEKYRE